MKKILLITDNAFTYSGREKICSFMTDVYCQAGHTVDVISCKGKPPAFYDFGGISRIKTLEGVKFPLFKIIKDIKKNNYDVVFIVSMGKLSVFFGALAFLFRVKNTQIIACEHVSISSLTWYIRLLKKVTLRKYDNVIVLTKRDKVLLKKWAINAEVIENPIDHLGINKGIRTYKAVAVGRLNKQKNFSELIHIWALFLQDNPSWILNILGDGEDKDKLLKIIDQLNLKGKVFIRGKVDDPEVYYANSDICVMSSIYEGLPMALLEAKSYSLPSVAYDCLTGPREIIQNDVDGYVIELHNIKNFVEKLDIISKNDDLFYSLSKSTADTCQRFSSENIKRKWISLVEE